MSAFASSAAGGAHEASVDASDCSQTSMMQLPRKQKKILKQALRAHDPEAAKLLLAHSVALGHERLSVRRYLTAKYLAAAGLEAFRPFCVDAAKKLKPQELSAAAAVIARELHMNIDVHGALSELASVWAPLILPYAGVAPRLSRGPRYCGAHVSLLGKVEIGDDAWLGPGAVLRADGHFVRIGDDFRIAQRSTMHIAHERYPAIVGDRVTVGRNAVIHACTIGNDCVIEDGAIVLDGSVVADGVVVEHDAIVYPRSTLMSGWLYAGCPAKPVRELEGGELAGRKQTISAALFASVFESADTAWSQDGDFGSDVFVAKTSKLQGAIQIGDRTGIFFGCELVASDAPIVVGADCNVQDNTIIDASRGLVQIGSDTTIGHNVSIKSCSIGSNALIGIGSDLGEGTIVDDDVLLAAGATTLAGQYLEKGWLWGGRPARRLSKLDDAKRSMMALTIETYRDYGRAYAVAQRTIQK